MLYFDLELIFSASAVGNMVLASAALFKSCNKASVRLKLQFALTNEQQMFLIKESGHDTLLSYF